MATIHNLDDYRAQNGQDDTVELDDGDGGGPTVIEIHHHYHHDEPEPKVSWGWTILGFLLGLGIGGG